MFNSPYSAEAEDAPTFSLTEALGVQGWRHLDAPLLAALATEAPLLLIGPHGTAKTWLIEKMADALGLVMRHYNASLINYDDLVGIPLPEPGNERLRFISTPGAIWDAEFVFFDEISRCRPDLQNKMFPIIHERKVAGIRLEHLRYRWAAMNPPAPDDLDGVQGEFYLGSEALDPALIDRFPFILPVPAWRQLSKEDRRRLVVRRPDVEDDGDARAQLPVLLETCISLIPVLESALEDWLTDYVVSAVDLLESASLFESPRRAYMLARAIPALHAARMVLEGQGVDLEYTAELALTYCLPQTATEVPPSRTTIVGIHRQAWEIASLAEDSVWRRVLEETDAVKRIAIADSLDVPDDMIARLITQALGMEKQETRRMGLAAVLFTAFHQRRDLTPAAWEPLAQLATKLFHPRAITIGAPRPGTTPMPEALREAIKPLADVHTLRERLERNFLIAASPDIWQKADWRAVLARFQADMNLFNIGDEAEVTP